MIKKDPTLLLIDVRSPREYANFCLPGASNIPLKDIFQVEKQELLNQKGVEAVFYSNGDILSDQAWILCKRKGLQNIYVMRGGLNEWFSAFFQIQPPPQTSSSADIELYQFRNGVRQYFTGGETEIAPKQQTESISVTPKAKKSASEGGC
jgi:rhodanese-related sulfurtransferase